MCQYLRLSERQPPWAELGVDFWWADLPGGLKHPPASLKDLPREKILSL